MSGFTAEPVISGMSSVAITMTRPQAAISFPRQRMPTSMMDMEGLSSLMDRLGLGLARTRGMLRRARSTTSTTTSTLTTFVAKCMKLASPLSHSSTFPSHRPLHPSIPAMLTIYTSADTPISLKNISTRLHSGRGKRKGHTPSPRLAITQEAPRTDRGAAILSLTKPTDLTVDILMKRQAI